MKDNTFTEDITNYIENLKKERNAVILAHNYQRGEVQDIADFTGDSLELARWAVDVDADILVVCGVDFMAESAAILNPDKIILHPEKEAKCPMAMMVSPSKLEKMKEDYPNASVVSYVNTSAEVKALSDICCTSANSVKVVNSLEEGEVIFVPDKNLAHWTSHHTTKKIIPWDGYCPTHHFLTLKDVINTKNEHPDAELLVHPECRPEVCEIADVVTSTSGMLRYVKKSEKKEFIIGTEIGLIHKMMVENPNKRFYPASEYLVCPSMKIPLESIAKSLEEVEPIVEVEEDVRKKAMKALERMLSVWGG